MRDISQIEGKEFFSAMTKNVYGIHESAADDLPEGFSIEAFGTPVAYDDCGNLFTENSSGQICFWDHETDEVVVIANDWNEFSSTCRKRQPVEVKESQVISAWVDPNFAREFGINASKAGLGKRKPWWRFW